MPAAPAISQFYVFLFGAAATENLFSDRSEVLALLLVEGALAKVQGGLGIIPADAATEIDRATQEVEIDPAALTEETARNGVPVPALLAAIRQAAGSPDSLQYLHWGPPARTSWTPALPCACATCWCCGSVALARF